MSTYRIEQNNKSEKNTNKHSLMLRITVNKIHARTKLIYAVPKKDFNKETKTGAYIRTSNSNHKKINQYLSEIILKAQQAEEELTKRGQDITAKKIKEELHQPKSFSIFTFLEEHNKRLLNAGTIGTYKKYNVILNVLKEYSNKNDLSFSEIDAKFLNDLQAWLKEKNKSQVTIHGYISKIRSVFNKAIEEKIINPIDSPFTTYKIKQGRPSKERLTIDEIERIKELDLKNNQLIFHVRNAFLFSFYTAGMRISDILQLKWENINNDRLTYTMHKTGKHHSMKIIDPGLKIIELYTKNKNKFVFPFLDIRYNLTNPSILHNQISAKTALLNKYLKKIAIAAEIDKRITTHTARHSFADIARQKTDNIYNLSKTLGHSSIQVTEAYLSSFDEKAVDDTLDNIFN